MIGMRGHAIMVQITCNYDITLVSQISLVAGPPARMQLKPRTVGMKATMKHVAGTQAALGEKHEQTPLIVTDWLSTVQGIVKGCNVPGCVPDFRHLACVDA